MLRINREHQYSLSVHSANRKVHVYSTLTKWLLKHTPTRVFLVLVPFRILYSSFTLYKNAALTEYYSGNTSSKHMLTPSKMKVRKKRVINEDHNLILGAEPKIYLAPSYFFFSSSFLPLLAFLPSSQPLRSLLHLSDVHLIPHI